jgi:hypothetical protein
LRNSTAKLDSRVFVSARSKSKIQFNGCEYASRDEMPVSVRVAYDRAVHETPALHSGARLAAKLKATIIVNDTEFNHAEALEALFPPSIAVSVNEAEARKSRHQKVLIIALAVSVLAGAVYLWLRSLVG